MKNPYRWQAGDTASNAEWDELVEQANDGTMFQMKRFLEYHPNGKFIDGSLALYKKGNLWGVFPAAVRERPGTAGESQQWLISHPGASYGGIITRKIPAFDEAMAIGALLLETAKTNGYSGIEITPPPLPYHNIPSDVWNFAFLQLGFQYRKRDYTQVVPLWTGDPLAAYDNKSCGALRHAEKEGVRIETVDLSEANWDIFHPMLVENRKKHNVTPAHTRTDLTVLTKLMPERLRLYFAYDKANVVVAATLIFIANATIHLTFYIAHDRDRSDLKAVVPLNHYSIVQAQREGAHWLDFGISTVNGVPGDGLIRFKENFGALGAWRDVYFFEL
ncbi:MAG: GNAT family N-acetyltransferase [bacterium]|nr:GNAT family N-acetyltransferase [bacterium]